MKLAIGTAQLGLQYGVAGNGNINQMNANEILDFAVSKKIYTVDTSPGYGDAHSKIGKCNLKELKIITKIPKINLKKALIKSEIRNQVLNYIKVLRCDRIHCLLLHNPSDILSSNGSEIYKSLILLKEEGLIEKIGVSTYEYEELNSIIDNFHIDIIQHPINILDRRLENSGMIKRLKDLNIEIHCRSVFLQGLLLSNVNQMEPKYLPFKKDVLKVQKFSIKYKKSIEEICLKFVINIKEVSKIVIGIDNLSQLKKLVEIEEEETNIKIPEFTVSNKLIMDPRKW